MNFLFSWINFLPLPTVFLLWSHYGKLKAIFDGLQGIIDSLQGTYIIRKLVLIDSKFF